MFSKAKGWLKKHFGTDAFFTRQTTLMLIGLMALSQSFVVGCGEGSGYKGLVEQLGSPQESERQSAVNELKRMGSEAIPEVTEMFLQAPDSEVGVRQVESTVKILVDAGSLAALQTLEKRMDDENREIRLYVVDGIAKLGQVRKKIGVRLLRKSIRDTYPPIVKTAADGLERMKFPNATRVLEEVFKEGQGLAAVYAAMNLYEVDQRDAAARYLLEISDAEDEKIREIAQKSATTLGTERSEGEAFVEYTVKYATKHPDAEYVETVLGDIRNVYFEELERALPPQRIKTIIGILGSIADQESVDKLVETLSDSGATVATRIAAAEALGEAALADRPAGEKKVKQSIIDVLRDVLEDSDVDSRIAIASSISLSLLKQETGVTYLLGKLQELEKAGDKEHAEEESKTYAKEPQDITELRCRAQEALTASGDFVVPYLLEELKKGDTGRIFAWAAMYTLGDLRVTEAVPYMDEMLTSTHIADEAMSYARDPERVTEVTVENEDEKQKVQTNRTTVYEQIFGDENVVPARALSVRMAAARGLGRVGGDEAARALEESEQLHKKIEKAVDEYLKERRYVDAVPANITVEAEKRKARDRLKKVARNIYREMGKVLFYIRQGSANLAAAE